MIKKGYMKPDMRVVKLQHRQQILVGSTDEHGMNRRLRTEDEEVDEAW